MTGALLRAFARCVFGWWPVDQHTQPRRPRHDAPRWER